MSALNESRIRHFLDHAQLALYNHEHHPPSRDATYREVLEFVDEIIDLLFEIRREQAALERIAGMWDAYHTAAPEEQRRMGARMCATAREALGLPLEPPSAPAPAAPARGPVLVPPVA